MTADKLFGAAAAYLMLGVLWAYFYAIVGYFYPELVHVLGQPGRLVFSDALYLSMTVLTSTGFGDISPVTRQARGICMVEQMGARCSSPSLSRGWRACIRRRRITSTTRQSRPCCDRNFCSTCRRTCASLISSMLCLMLSGNGKSSASR